MFYASSFWTIGGTGVATTEDIWWDRIRRRKIREMAYRNSKFYRNKKTIVVLSLLFWLVWANPLTNVDSTPLTDLAGIKLYCGRDSGVYTFIKDLGLRGGPGEEGKVQISGTASGSMQYCAVTAYDETQNESNYSNEVFINFGRVEP